MIRLEAVDNHLEAARNRVCIHRSADYQEPAGSYRCYYGGHIVIKSTGSGIVALVTPDAGPDIHIMRIYDPCMLSRI